MEKSSMKILFNVVTFCTLMLGVHNFFILYKSNVELRSKNDKLFKENMELTLDRFEKSIEVGKLTLENERLKLEMVRMGVNYSENN